MSFTKLLIVLLTILIIREIYGAEMVLKKPPKQQTGILLFTVEPMEAVITLSNGMKWEGSKSVSLPAGEYRIKASSTGYIPLTTTVRIEKNITTKVDVLLLKPVAKENVEDVVAKDSSSKTNVTKEKPKTGGGVSGKDIIFDNEDSSEQSNSDVIEKRSALKGKKVTDNNLILMPTANTMPAGSSVLSNIDALAFQYSYGVTSWTHLSAGVLAILNEYVYAILSSFAIKQKYLDYQKLTSAIIVAYMPAYSGTIIGNIISLGGDTTSVHLGVIRTLGDNDNFNKTIIMMGGICYAVSPKISLIGETHRFIYDNDSDAYQMILFGTRFKGRWTNLDLGVLGWFDNKGKDGLLPIIKVSFKFD